MSDGIMEEHRVLRHHCYGRPKAGERHGVYWLAAYLDTAGVWLEEPAVGETVARVAEVGGTAPVQEPDYGRLATTRASYYGVLLASRHCQGVQVGVEEGVGS